MTQVGPLDLKWANIPTSKKSLSALYAYNIRRHTPEQCILKANQLYYMLLYLGTKLA